MNKLIKFFIFLIMLSQIALISLSGAASDLTYPGPFNIPVNKLNLTGEELKGEEHFAELLQLNPSLTEALYDELPSTEHGKILDVDLARKLFPPFSDGTEGANLYSVSTHMPASQFINYLFNYKVEKIANEKTTPQIIFLAGGGGSGKGTVTVFFPNIYETADLILDGTLSNFEKAKERINFALEHGFKVSVIYVFRPIELAVQGIVTRAIRTGRGVPMVVAAEAHFGAQKTVFKLSKEFKEKINLIIISNAGGLKDAKAIKSMDELVEGGFNYETQGEVVIRAIEAYLNFINNMDPKLQKNLSPQLKNVFEKGMEKNMSNFVNQFEKEVSPIPVKI